MSDEKRFIYLDEDVVIDAVYPFSKWKENKVIWAFLLGINVFFSFIYTISSDEAYVDGFFFSDHFSFLSICCCLELAIFKFFQNTQ